MRLLNVTISVASTLSGAFVASLVYTALRQTGAVSAATTRICTHGAGVAAGVAAGAAFGPSVGSATQQILVFTGDNLLASSIDFASEKTAIVISVAAGAATVATTYVILLVGIKLTDVAIHAIKAVFQKQWPVPITYTLTEDAAADFSIIHPDGDEVCKTQSPQSVPPLTQPLPPSQVSSPPIQVPPM
jgi:hypothetical protein